MASINDLFGNKERLFKAVIARRADDINEDRAVLLSRVEPGASREQAVREIVEAFARPLLARAEESEGWRNYMRLIAQLSNSRSAVLLLIADHFNPLASRFAEAVGEVIPELDERQRLVAYQLMLSSVMSMFSDNCRMNIMSGNAFQSSDYAAHFDDLVRYVSGGLLAMGA